MKKLLLLMSLLVVFVLSCGGKKEAAENGEKKMAESDVIKIGVIGPLTGEVAQYGEATINGFKLKVKEINEAGGINGKKIELVISDSKGDSTEAVNIFKKMVSQDKVNLVVGEVISSASLAIADLAQSAKIPMITPTGTNFDITKGKDYVFRTTFTDPYQGVITAKYAQAKGIKSVAILTNSSNDYAVGLATSFKDEAAKNGITVTEEKYTKDDKDFKSILTKIKGQNPEAVFIPDYYNTIGLILTQANELGLKTQYLGGDGWDGIQTNFGAAAEGAIFASQFAPDDTAEIVQKFITAYKSEYKIDPIVFSALGYDTGSILEAALKSVKDLSPASIREALAATNASNLVTGDLKYDAERNPEKKVTFIEVKGGKLVLKEKL
ncbi:MAG: ABC transporter substrate-binding protein [Leptotrichiaceae bacterium]|nr:ABC transporter substrate-binding protein [Leptotrichiaceae bacterium]